MKKETKKRFLSKNKRVTMIAMLLGLGLLSFKKAVDNHPLSLTIENIQESGTLFVSVYASSSEWTENGSYNFALNPEQNKSNTFELPSIPKGKYAIALYQDINGNGRLDTNFFGIPKEPYAFSNNKKPLLSAPSFEACSFEFSENNQKISIKLLNY